LKKTSLYRIINWLPKVIVRIYDEYLVIPILYQNILEYLRDYIFRLVFLFVLERLILVFLFP